MNKHAFVIVSMDTGKFWGGKRWVAKWPDAHKYDNNVRAIQICSDLNSGGAYAKVVWDYGLDTERKVYPDVPASTLPKWPGSIGG